MPYILEPDRQHPFGALSQAGKDFSGLVSYLRTYLISTALGGNSSDSAEELPASVFDGYSAEEQAFVRGFRNQHSRWPLFYMVQKYFVHTSCSGDVIFASLYGLRGNDPLTAEEASKSFGYTRATVEQKVKSVSGNLSFELRSLIGNNDWKKYTFLKKPCFLLDSTHPDLEITQTLSDECVEPSLNLVAAMGRIFGRSVLFVDRQSLRTSSLAFPQTAFKIIAAPPLDKFLFRAALKDMVADSSIQREQPVVVDIRSRFVNDSMYWLHPTPLKNEQQLALVDVLGVCFERLLGAKYNNGIAIFPPDKVAYRDELYWILKSAGTRLHIDEIFRRLEEQHPDMKYQTPAQIAYYLKTDPRIKSIGKSSYWDLVERSRTAGSIRKMAIDTVGWAETPISLKELTESILARRPDTNAASIRSIVWQCIVSGDLCSENGRLCLPSKVHGEV